MPKKNISIRIDGELVTAPEGQTILEAARANGKKIPTLCWLEGLSAVGACRVCMVELAGTDRLLPACTTPVQDGMSINTVSAKLSLYRRMAVELLLVERNHVCSACVSNGHCELQSLAQSLGVSHVRYSYNCPSLPVDMTHPRFVLDHNRCILCTRCVRVCAELEGEPIMDREGLRQRCIEVDQPRTIERIPSGISVSVLSRKSKRIAIDAGHQHNTTIAVDRTNAIWTLAGLTRICLVLSDCDIYWQTRLNGSNTTQRPTTKRRSHETARIMYKERHPPHVIGYKAVADVIA